MKAEGVKPHKLAVRAGLQPSHLYKWLGGKVTPSVETMLILDEAMTIIEEGI